MVNIVYVCISNISTHWVEESQSDVEYTFVRVYLFIELNSPPATFSNMKCFNVMKIPDFLILRNY